MSPPVSEQPTQDFDVAVIGGGAAGLTAAVTLGRARRSALVIDSGAPRNALAGGVHMFLTRDGIPPAELVKIGRQEVEFYGGRIVHGEAQAARRTGEGFEVTLDKRRCHDRPAPAGRPNVPDMLYTAQEIAAALDPDDWQIIVAAAPERQAPDPEGRTVTIRDAVLKAVRRR